MGVPIVGRDAGPAALTVGAVGLAVTIAWHDRRRVVAVASTGLYAAAATIAIVLADVPGLPDGDAWVLFSTGVAAGVVTLFGPGRVASVEDRKDGEPLRAARVRLARVVAGAMATAVSLSAGPGLVGPVWAALVATALRPR